MKELLEQYAQYNAWANKRMAEAMLKLDASQIDQGIPSSFPSPRFTVSHTWSAEYIWLQRLQLVENPVWIGNEYAGPFEEICDGWLNASAGLLQFTEKQYDDSALQHVVQYYDRAKASHKTPVYQVLHHVFNHSTYHRGQMVTMLRQLNAKEIPGTDFIGFARKK